MGDRHDISGQALDLAVAGKPAPGKAWEGLLPPDDLGHMVDAGSANIPLFSLAAALKFGPLAWARSTCRRYAVTCRTRFMLAEPWSRKYGKAIVVSWAAIVYLARKIGDAELAALFMELLESFLGTCELMAARLREAPPGANKWERQRVNTLVVAMPGCRSWGLTGELEGGFDDLLHVAKGISRPKPKGKAGDMDDWGFVDRVLAVVESIFVEAFQKFRGNLSPAELLERIPRWAARETFVLYGWRDGSRLGTMGASEPERVDEDDNSNTTGTLLKGVLGGRLVVLPNWPDPLTGATKIRQTAVEADVDGSPAEGWRLWHSALGQVRDPASGGKLSSVPSYLPDDLVFAIEVPAGSLAWRDLLAGGLASPGSPATPATPSAPAEPSTPAPSSPGGRRSRRRRRRGGGGVVLGILVALVLAALWAAL